MQELWANNTFWRIVINLIAVFSIIFGFWLVAKLVKSLFLNNKQKKLMDEKFINIKNLPNIFSNNTQICLVVNYAQNVDLKILDENEDIEGLISCAGVGYFGNLENFSLDQILSSLNTNLLSHVILTKYLVPFFKKKNKGKLIYIGSESALDGGKKGSLYSAAKFGLRGFTQSIRAELASRNITVTLINPGMVKTNFFNNLNFQPGLSKKNSIVVYDIAKVVISILQMDTNTSVDEVVMNPIIKSVIKK